jgi:diguanylate cyclase (GGDEF)-like protein
MLASGYGLIASLDPSRGETLRRAVAGAGLEPLVTRDGDEARAALRRRGAPGLMVTELSLPRFDGFRLLEALRRVATIDETPAIVVSAFAPLRDAAERLRRELGISAILPPRASAYTVQRVVKRALDRGEADLGAPLYPIDELSTPPRGAGAIGSRAGDPTLRGVLGPLLTQALRALGVPVGFVALLDGDLPWLASHIGLAEDAPEALLLSTEVTAANDLLVIPDASRHPLFAYDLRPVMQGFAATPIVTSRGEMVGALGVADDGPLLLGPAELEELALHARRLAGAIELAAGAAPTVAPLDGAPQLATVLAHLDSGVALVDAGGRLVHGNAALAEMCDLDPSRLAGMRRADLADALVGLAADGAEVARRLRVGEGSYAAREELELLRPRRRVLRWVARPLRLGDALGQLEIFDDITAEVDLARERELLARTDWLTGLVNRRGGEEAIAREVARARRLGTTLCFALFDVDRFKQVNDAHGHPVGDEVLKAVAQVLHTAVRASDLTARWGGDELLVVLPAITEVGARVFAERVRKRVAALDVGVTVSCGVAELGRFEDAGAAISRADQRLYEAKAEGKNRVR